MHKKHFIALADHIREFNTCHATLNTNPFSEKQLSSLADFCQAQNPRFNRARWLCYIKGACGPNGGAK